MIFRTLALAVAVSSAVVAPVAAQVRDHLQCYKIKDTSLVAKGTLDLEDVLSGPLSPCKISSAKLFCRATAASNKNVLHIQTPVVPLPYTGVELADNQDRLCYKVSCPKLDPPVADQVVTDPFGQHTLIKLKTGMLCTPANVGAQYCGDGAIDANEQCDGSDLGGATCVTLGYGSGTLACAPGCGYDVSACVAGAFPASGQTVCYTAAGAVTACAGTGQDGEKQAGADLAYQDNGDGTVTDLNTGLTWEKHSDDGSVHDRDTLFTWATAQSHIATLNGAAFAGHTDWRMPNVRELTSIVNYGAVSPAVTTSAFHTNCFGGCAATTCSCTAFLNHWSSTTSANTLGSAFTVNFNDGTVGVFTKGSPGNLFAVRAVRGGPQ